MAHAAQCVSRQPKPAQHAMQDQKEGLSRANLSKALIAYEGALLDLIRSGRSMLHPRNALVRAILEATRK